MSAFSKRTDVKYHKICKECHNVYSKLHYEANRKEHIARKGVRNKIFRKEQSAKLNALKNNQECTDCKTRYPYYVLEFDHINDNKINNVANLIGMCGWSKVQAEIDKCELVCSNCHRIRTHKRRIINGNSKTNH